MAKESIFGESHVDDIAKEYNIPVVAKLPLKPELVSLCDKGTVELFNQEYLDDIVQALEKLRV